MIEKYLMLNLNDEKAGKVAEAMANKTCKKILSLLADKEMSEKDISDELKMPINTVDYNIKNLLSVGLIEKSKNYFWSVKGRRIETYNLSNKKILISTKPSFKGMFGMALVFGAVGFFANVFKNIFDISKEALYPIRSIASPSMDYSTGVETAVSAVSKTGAVVPPIPEINPIYVTSNNIFSFSSIFHNVWLWVCVGILVGILGFILYKYLKGGSNKL